MATTERAYGPYRERSGWRIVVVGADGRRASQTLASEITAQRLVDDINARSAGRTVKGAIEEYERHLRAAGKRDTTIDTVGHRLRALLDVKDGDRALSSLKPSAGRRLFDARALYVKPETQHGELVTAWAFAAWMIERGWIREDPFAGLVPTGPRARGKAQLRIDEARAFEAACLAENSPESIACALALLLAMRASEICDLLVRDIDDGARVVWVDGTKTEAAKRALETPEHLRSHLLELTSGKARTGRVFGDLTRRGLHYHVQRLCRTAGVPVVSPHCLRGTHGSIARAVGASVEAVAAALGHASTAVTRANYVTADAEQTARQRAAWRVLDGGRAAEKIA